MAQRHAHQHTSTPAHQQRTSPFCGASKTEDFDIDVSSTSTPAHQHTGEDITFLWRIENSGFRYRRVIDQHTSTPAHQQRTSLFCGVSKTQDFDIDVSSTSTPAHQHTTSLFCGVSKTQDFDTFKNSGFRSMISIRPHTTSLFCGVSKTQDFDTFKNSGFRSMISIRPKTHPRVGNTT